MDEPELGADSVAHDEVVRQISSIALVILYLYPFYKSIVSNVPNQADCSTETECSRLSATKMDEELIVACGSSEI